MIRNSKILVLASQTAAIAITLVLFTAGCSVVKAPTAAEETLYLYNDLWYPQPGEELVPGHGIPWLNDGYWGSWGPIVNPQMMPRSSVPVGPSGGTVSLGLHSCMIPPGAVNSSTTFTLAFASPTAIAVDCGPSPYQFNAPVMLTLSYAGTQYENVVPPPPLQIFYMAPGGQLTPLPTIVNPGLKTVSAHVDHFSRYIVG